MDHSPGNRLFQPPEGESVLLFSGGLDSLILYKLVKPSVLVYFELGHKYQEKELQAITELSRAVDLPIIRDSRLNLSDIEYDSGYIPLRNLYLVEMASIYGNTVILAGTKGETSKDKSKHFMRMSNKLIKYCHSGSSGHPGQAFQFIMPSLKFTKTALIKEYLRQGHDPELLKLSTSCYHSTLIRCGKCNACLRRWVAMESNGIHEEYHSDPRELIAEFRKKGLSSTFGKESGKLNVRDFIVAIPNNMHAMRTFWRIRKK